MASELAATKGVSRLAQRFLSSRPGAQKTVRKKKPGRFVRNDDDGAAAYGAGSVEPEGDHGVDARGASCGDVGGEDGHEQEHQRGDR